MLCHYFWHGLLCFLVKPYLSTTHWEIKTGSCLWPVATEEVPCSCCHQWSLLHHNFTSFLGSALMLPKICDGLVWGHHSKPQTQRSCTPCYILPVSCSRQTLCLHTKHTGGKPLYSAPPLGVKNLHLHHPQLLASQTKLWRKQSVSLGTQLLFFRAFNTNSVTSLSCPYDLGGGGRGTVPSPLCPLP